MPETSEQSNERSITWRTQEYDFTPKSKEWYWVIGIVAGGIMVASLLLANILFAILIAIAAFCIMLFGARPPKPVLVELSSQGIKLNEEYYSYKSLESFWINNTEPLTIIFKSKKALSPFIIIPLEYLSPDNTREFLLKHLPEEEHQIPFAELLSRRLGF